ncbi:MAG: TAXI family TRAP transporter solute-binding subunit [Deltaproteobacteria bacterium]|nr:TAXI family TRAP transporter solute-binding subunit [Deltaproteobacteria bacterium]
MKRFAIFVVAVCFLGLLSGTALAAEKWGLGTSSAGSGPYRWGAWISKMINKHQSAVSLSSQATAGFNENIELVNSGQVPIAEGDMVCLLDAYKGVNAFQGKPHPKLRVMFSFMVAPLHIVTRAAADIKTIADLKGKKFNLGIPAQTTRAINEMLLTAAGLQVSDVKKFEMSTGQTFRAMQDRVIDATGNVYSAGMGRLVELANNIDIRLLAVPDDVFERMNKSLDGAFFRVTIPGKIYKGQAAAVETAGLAAILFTTEEVPADLVYGLTKAFWANLAEVKTNKYFQGLETKYAIPTSQVPLHPGAEKYFKEAGILK